MFYVVNKDDGRILESYHDCPDPKEEAELFRCPIYIIEGEHTGLEADGSAKVKLYKNQVFDPQKKVWKDLPSLYGNQGKAEDGFERFIALSPELSYQLIEIIITIESEKLIKSYNGKTTKEQVE